MPVPHELLSQCLDVTKQLIALDKKAAINIRIGNDFVFSFNNQETFDEKKKSPSQIKRNFLRKAAFENTQKENRQTVKTETNALATISTLDKTVETKDAETQIDVHLTSIGTNTDKEDFKDITNDELDNSEKREIRPKENETILEMGLNHEDLDETKVETYIKKHTSLIGKPWIANNGKHFVTVGFKTKTCDFEKWKTKTANWHDSGRIRAVTFSRHYQ